MTKFNNLKQNISYEVYEDLKYRIMTLNLAPRTVLKEVDLSEEYELSRTPIREAIKQLKIESFVFYDEDAGNKVAPISIKNYTELFQLREALEVLSVKLASLNMDDDDTHHLEQNIKSQLLLISGHQSPSEFLKLDREFHSLIAMSADNSLLVKLIQNYYDLLYRYDVFCSYENQFVYTVSEHQKIFNALLRKDLLTSVQTMETHMNNLNSLILLRLVKKFTPDISL